jgi:hypothetical protein
MHFGSDAVAVYEVVCKETATAVDAAMLAKMKAANELRLKEIDDAIKDAIENEGDMEVRDATMAKAQILARTADKATAVAAYDEAEKYFPLSSLPLSAVASQTGLIHSNLSLIRLPKTTSGQKLDCRMDLMRIGMFWADIPMTEAHVKVCKEVVFLSCRCMRVFYACISIDADTYMFGHSWLRRGGTGKDETSSRCIRQLTSCRSATSRRLPPCCSILFLHLLPLSYTRTNRYTFSKIALHH